MLFFFFFNDTATTEIYTTRHTLSLHDALPIYGRLLRRSDAVVLDPPARAGPDGAALGEQELGVLHQLGVMLHQPRRSDTGTHLFVRRREENDVALERHAGALEREQRHQLRDRFALHVERAPPPQIAVLHGSGEGVDHPELGAR